MNFYNIYILFFPKIFNILYSFNIIIHARIKARISAIGAAHNIPFIPKLYDKIIRHGIRNTTSLESESIVAFIGFPIDCRKILLAFCMQQKSIPLRYIRKHKFAYSL